MISPAHFFDTAFGGSAHGVEQGGLTEKGRAMVRRMEARGVILDLAHASARTIDDALTIATRPVVASHTGVRGVVDNARNLSDAHLDGIAATGGLVGIGFWETACGGRDAASIARSIAYAVERVGAGHVALGSDWDGAVGVPFDAANIVRMWNPAAERIFGWKEADVLNKPLTVVPDSLGEDSREQRERAQAGEIVWVEDTQRLHRELQQPFRLEIVVRLALPERNASEFGQGSALQTRVIAHLGLNLLKVGDQVHVRLEQDGGTDVLLAVATERLDQVPD